MTQPVSGGAPLPSAGANAVAASSHPITVAINQLFNSAFNWLANSSGGPISNLAEGALVLIRRSLFFIPSGVSATQTGTELSIVVNSGSVAYVRQDGPELQVSNVPLYWGAENFTAATVSDVRVTNPGTAGSAGLVLHAGSIVANLSTSQIDSIRFDNAAEFTGTVTATLHNGTLGLSTAVRGLAGVTLDAPVRLDTDVEVQAGQGNATFTGTVDAAKYGHQSLVVTALGATAFQAAVGGNTPLAGLTTRGVTPLTIEQSADSETIPLHYLQDLEGSLLRPRYGIDVAIGDNPSQLYQFDTGGTGFFAGYNSPFWQDVPLSTQPVSTLFGGGYVFDGVASTADITLGGGSQSVSTAEPIQIAAVVSGRSGTGQSLDFTNPDNPPVLGLFFGNFGADFRIQDVNGQPTLASPLFQLPGNLSSGFLVQLGPVGTQPQLTVGVTDALRAQFPYAIALGPTTGVPYPVSGYESLPELAFTGEYSVTQSGVSIPLGTDPSPRCTAQCLPTLFDTGESNQLVSLPRVTPPYPYAVGPLLQPGTTFSATFPTAEGRPPLTWSFTAGTTISANLVAYSPGQPSQAQYVNGGLNAFNDFDVMFDVENQVIWLRPSDGQATVALNSVNTVGAQRYAQNAELAGMYSTGNGAFSVGGMTTLQGDTVVSAGSGDVTFYGTVDGNHALAVNSSATTTFTRTVGASGFLTNLRTDAGGTSRTAEAFTTGDQTYGDDVTLVGAYISSQGRFTVAGSTTLVGPGDVRASGDIVFGGPVESQNGKGFPLTLSTSADVLFDGSVGAVGPLGGLAIGNSSHGQTATVATAVNPVNLDGSLGNSTAEGLAIGDDVTVAFTGGGVVQRFAGAGIEFTGDSPNSQLSGFVVNANGGDGIRAGVTGGIVSGLEVIGNAIIGNKGNGVAIIGPGSADNAILSNSIYGNAGDGIALVDDANGGQSAPQDITVHPTTSGTTEVSGTVVPVDGYAGDFEIQVFTSPPSQAGPQGQNFLGTVTSSGTAFTFEYPSIIGLGERVTVTATPMTGDRNTSAFSQPV